MAVRAGCDLIGARRSGLVTVVSARLGWHRDRHRKSGGRRVEGPGSFGAGLTRWLRARGVVVLEVSRPNRQLRRHAGKSDQIDAEAAARAVQAGAALGRPKTTDGQVEMLRALRVA